MRIPLLLTFSLLAVGCGLRLSKMTATQRGERLAIERAKLPELSNPIDKTKSYITISDLLLSFASDALREQDINDLNALMDQYVAAITRARDTMVESDGDPTRRPQGYKDLEIALRRQLTLLQDLSRQSLADERAPVDRATNAATSVRQQIIGLLFPQATPTSSLIGFTLDGLRMSRFGLG